MKIKTKLLTSIGGTIIILLSISFFFLITITTGTIKEETIRELNHQTISIEEQIENLIESSAKSYLSAIGDQSDSVATTLKTLSQPEEFIIDTLLQMEIFGSGYLFITNSDGIIIGHPEKSKVGTISPMMSWLNRLKPTDKKFKEYEEVDGFKLVYRVYNNEYDFNICVTAYTKDFIDAVDISELDRILNNIKIGKTGYPFLVSAKGEILTNRDRSLIGKSINHVFTQGKRDNNFLIYTNSGEGKLSVAIRGDYNELYETVDVIKQYITISGVILVIILFSIILFISTKISKPIVDFTESLNEISHGHGDIRARIVQESHDEIGDMVIHFNHFLDVLHDMIDDIKASVTKTEEIKEKIKYRVNETSATVNKIGSNITSIKNQAKQLDSDKPEQIREYLDKSMDHIKKGSEKITTSMSVIQARSIDLEENSKNLSIKVNRFKT